MRGDFVEQQQARACLAIAFDKLRMGEGDGDQHRLLLAGRTLGGRLVPAGHGHGQFVAVRAGEGALRGPVARAAVMQRDREGIGGDRSARLVGERGPGEGRFRKGC